MKIWQSLGYIGLSPFLICLWLSTSTSSTLLVNPKQAFILYSGVILSFLSGTLWRKDTLVPHTEAQFFSNILCLYAYFCLLLPMQTALYMLPIGYICLLLIEYFFCNKKEYAFSRSYLTMRIILTVVVSTLHAIALTLWFY